MIHCPSPSTFIFGDSDRAHPGSPKICPSDLHISHIETSEVTPRLPHGHLVTPTQRIPKFSLSPPLSQTSGVPCNLQRLPHRVPSATMCLYIDTLTDTLTTPSRVATDLHRRAENCTVLTLRTQRDFRPTQKCHAITPTACSNSA